MARIRTIKPEFWTDETMVRLPFEARLLYVGLWNFADDYGHVWDEPDRIKMQVFPGDDLNVASLLDLLEAAGRIERYETPEGARYWAVIRFSEHQRVDKPSKSAIPERAKCSKVAIPSAVRRQVAQKYGCTPGETVQSSCFYCGEQGTIRWWRHYSGKPSAWVSFDLELDHFVAEGSGGETSVENIVLACRGCNRRKLTADGLAFLTRALASPPPVSRALASPREPSLQEGKGREGRGKEEEGNYSAAADAPPVSQGGLLEVHELPAPAKKPRKDATGPNAELWRALEAEYEKRMGAKYVSGNGGADASTVSWLLANTTPPEAVRRWGLLLEWSKGGFPNVGGFVALRSHWNAPQVVGLTSATKGSNSGAPPAEDEKARLRRETWDRLQREKAAKAAGGAT